MDKYVACIFPAVEVFEMHFFFPQFTLFTSRQLWVLVEDGFVFLFSLAESDVPAELQVLKGPLQQPTFPFAVANQLLLVSLLEHLSHVHEPNPLRSRQVFKCQ